MYNVVITADIEKMYRQIWVQPDQRPLQKIFWHSNPEESIKVFKLNTITYGTASAPFLAVRCLKQLAMNHEQQYPEISKIIAEDFYMDDLITGATTTEEMQNIVSEIVTIMKSVGFNLRKWTSNEPKIIENQLSLSNTEVHFDTKDNTKILGLYWCSDSDTLRFKINSKTHSNNKITKRIVISELAQIFDPLGLLAPCIIMGKIIIQKLWLLKLSWDESLPLDIHTQWLNFRNQLPLLNEKQIQRQVICKNAINIQLHGFCDSSEQAYGACVYVRSENSNKDIEVKLLCSKTRVAPLKIITIPRLELCSALLLSKLIQKVLKSLRMTINQIYLWSDSTITLNWIQTEPYKLNIFVANRVNQIQNLTNIDYWRYVNTKSNPADLLTRGITPLMLTPNNMWWTGPTWLKEPKDQWPQAEYNKLDDIPETKQKYITSMHAVPSLPWLPFNRFSKLSILKRTIAYCLRFVNNCRLEKENRQYGELTSVELNRAFIQIVKCSQLESFEKEIKDLKDKKSISSKSKLYKLNVFLDENELLRVGGRLHHSPIPYNQRHPKVLSSSHPLTRLLLLHEHQKLLHIGTQGLIASIRQEFWPLSIRNLARKIVHNCTTCFKAKPKIAQMIMGNLPETRVTPSLPFTNVGVDFAGPFMVKNKDGRGWKPIKMYVCVFICMSTKAIHLEAVSGLSTELFLAPLRRFTSRRGKPANIFSDNGTNFVGANRQINEMYELITQNQQELIKATADENITWHFIPPYAPNFGGLWESGVKMMKNHLMKTIKNTIITYEQLNTVLSQIEAILNSRPLLPLTDNPDDLESLTPSHFLIRKTLTSIPEPNLLSIPENRLSVWQNIQKLQQHFWTRWQRDYLSELQQRQRRGKTETTLKVGDLVIVKDDNLPVLKWLMGRITRLFPGNDGKARNALIKTSYGEIKRAISKICVLPVEENETF